MSLTERVMVRFDKDTMRRLQGLATRADRRLSEYVRWLVKRALAVEEARERASERHAATLRVGERGSTE